MQGSHRGRETRTVADGAQLAVWNADFKEVFAEMSVQELNQMELELLRWLDYRVSLSASQYVKSWFALRELSELDPATFPLKPLDKTKLQKLEVAPLPLQRSPAAADRPGRRTHGRRRRGRAR